MRYLAVFGDPISHSISPRLHNLAMQKLGIEGFYGRVHMQECGEEPLKNRFNALGLSGANVTIPHKQTAAKIANRLDAFASKTGAANTLVCVGGELLGFNTDAPGFMMAIRDFDSIKNALIIGAGGTARALAAALNADGIGVSVLNRSDRASEFEGYGFYTHDTISVVTGRFDLIINTTPAGLIDSELPASEQVLDRVFSGARYAFDAVYGRETPFLRFAKNRKMEYRDGKEMLLNQAAIAFCHFFDDCGLRAGEVADIMRPALDL